MRAIRVTDVGGPERLVMAEFDTPAPGLGEILVRISAIGVNFIDVYFRTGLYPATLPFTPGMEAAGRIAAVGADVTDFAVGDRVAYAMVRGSYADHALVPADKVVPVPARVDDRTAAAVMLQGMTAHYLTRSTFPLAAGHTVLVHAAAGGVGLLLVQMANRLGARVIATVSTAEKAALAREAGAADVINYTDEDFQRGVSALTNGLGVDVVYDSVGAATFTKGLACLKPRGLMVSFGNSSGPVPAVEPLALSQHGSLFLTRPSLGHYLASREELIWRAGDVLRAVADGTLTVHIARTYPLGSAADAHRDLESRKTMGKLLLAPDA